MSRDDYFLKYYHAVYELTYLVKSLRAIARDNHIALSTVVRIKHKLGL